MNPIRKMRLAGLKRALAIAEARLELARSNGWEEALPKREQRVGYYRRRIALLELRQESRALH
ncbi:MAG: hypothetical protein Kow0032_07650 [Methyloligellaceae bacterium]